MQKEKEKKPSQSAGAEEHVGQGCLVTGTGMQVSTSAYPYRRFKLTHDGKVVSRGLPSELRGREKKRAHRQGKTRIFQSEEAEVTARSRYRVLWCARACWTSKQASWVKGPLMPSKGVWS